MIIFGIDISQIAQNPFGFMWFLFTHGGWVIFVVIIFWGIWLFWINWIQSKFAASLSYSLLAIDIPKENEQSPKAVENMFAHIAGAHKGYTLYEKYWEGKLQAKFSFEIVSLDGYVQFLVYTPDLFRDLVEAAIYAQYPEAEIAEVEDYAQKFPTKFPNDEYQLWGSEFIYGNKWQFPIRTYPVFEHSLSQELKDPLAALLESFNKMQKGENAWMQIVLTVTDSSWTKESRAFADKLMGKRGAGSAGGKKGGYRSGESYKMYDTFTTQVLGGPTASKDVKSEEPSKILYMSPMEAAQVEAVERKASKVAFYTKIRYMYLAKKNLYSKTRGVSPFIGVLKQVSDANLNGLKTGKASKTDADYIFPTWRTDIKRTKIMAAYKGRSNWSGNGPGFIMNTEELATLYHFPTLESKAPHVKKSEAKKASPPIGLPTEGSEEKIWQEVTEETAPPPEDLPT